MVKNMGVWAVLGGFRALEWEWLTSIYSSWDLDVHTDRRTWL